MVRSETAKPAIARFDESSRSSPMPRSSEPSSSPMHAVARARAGDWRAALVTEMDAHCSARSRRRVAGAPSPHARGGRPIAIGVDIGSGAAGRSRRAVRTESGQGACTLTHPPTSRFPARGSSRSARYPPSRIGVCLRVPRRLRPDGLDRRATATRIAAVTRSRSRFTGPVVRDLVVRGRSRAGVIGSGRRDMFYRLEDVGQPEVGGA